MVTSNPNLKKVVFPETPLKHALVDFTGEKFKPQNGEVTVDMILQALGEEFPELIWALAEENFFRGYEQALSDTNSAQAALNQKQFEE